ncbi:MAG: GNAT family N-acetyltransferase [Clostridia bacterium]|nr:GNAT family N-acetyltransferase [Clostridia bacterium]
MTINDYQTLAMRTLNPALSKKDVLINGVMGLCGEAGEAIDIVKKHLAQGHDLDRNALIKELGDVAWYLAETAYALDVSLEEVFQRNIDKLKARYPQGFETERSLHRGDDMRIERAKPDDVDAVFALYHSLLDTPYSTWSEEYPSRELVAEDVRGGKTIVMRDPSGRIVAAIALLPGEEEDEFDDMAPWYADAQKWAVPSRLGVAVDQQGKGIAKRMLTAALDAARQEGSDAVRFLVAKRNPIPQRAYASLNFDVCGECELWGEHWLCYQKRLAP